MTSVQDSFHPVAVVFEHPQATYNSTPPSTEGTVYVQFLWIGISFLAPQVAQTTPRGQGGNYPRSKVFSCH